MGGFGGGQWGNTQWGGVGQGGGGGAATNGLPQTSTITTSTPITWANGSLYNGWLMLGVALPTAAAGSNFASITLWANMPPQPLPQWTMIPIVAGVLDQITTVFQSPYLDPPGCRYVAYWLDTNKNVVSPAGGAAPALFDITTSQYVITQPYLANPTTPNVIPAPQSPGSVATYLKGENYSTPAYETPQGTVDGNNNTFTISRVPNFLMFLVDGQMQAPGTYFVQGSTIICSIPPTVGATLTAVIF